MVPKIKRSHELQVSSTYSVQKQKEHLPKVFFPPEMLNLNCQMNSVIHVKALPKVNKSLVLSASKMKNGNQLHLQKQQQTKQPGTHNLQLLYHSPCNHVLVKSHPLKTVFTRISGTSISGTS